MATHINSYQLITDHLGSIKLVVDIATGTVMQRLDYDEYGNAVYDSNIMIYTLDIASVFVPFSSIYPF